MRVMSVWYVSRLCAAASGSGVAGVRAQGVRSKDERARAQAGTGFRQRTAALECKVPQLRRDDILTDTAPGVWGEE